MRTLPTREGIRAETRVNNGQRGFHQWVGEVRVEREDLPRGQHALVDQGFVGQTGNIEIVPPRDIGIPNSVLSLPANDIEFALEGQIIMQISTALDKHLTDERFSRLRRFPQIQIVGRHAAPAEDLLAFPAHDVFKAALTLMPLLPGAGQEDHADSVLSRPWQL